jgi:hypothetical protein
MERPENEVKSGPWMNNASLALRGPGLDYGEAFGRQVEGGILANFAAMAARVDLWHLLELCPSTERLKALIRHGDNIGTKAEGVYFSSTTNVYRTHRLSTSCD